jgi:hypothetical protein
LAILPLKISSELAVYGFKNKYEGNTDLKLTTFLS